MADGLCEAIEAGYRFLMNHRIIERQVAFNNGLDQFDRLFGKPASSHFGSKRRISAQSFLGFNDAANRSSDGFRVGLYLRFSRGEPSEREMTDVGWVVAAPDIDEYFPYSTPDRSFASHSVGPKAIDLPGL